MCKLQPGDARVETLFNNVLSLTVATEVEAHHQPLPQSTLKQLVLDEKVGAGGWKEAEGPRGDWGSPLHSSPLRSAT